MTAQALPDPYEVEPFDGRLDAVVRPPGSKSLTNRALLCAAAARGTSLLEGVLFADDTEAMLSCLADLGVRLRIDRDAHRVEVTGARGAPRVEGALLDARLSGTTARFIMPFAALGTATIVIDGASPLRRRPMADLIDALAELGAQLEPLGEPGHLPVRVEGRGLRGGTVEVRGDVSSQFLSGLLMCGPDTDEGLVVRVGRDLVSLPYVRMTIAVMEAFGARVDTEGDRTFHIESSGYRAAERHVIEPDASAASYFFGAAAILDGRVRVEGLGTSSIQGDVAFVDALEAMGVTVRRSVDAIEVEGTGSLRGVQVDFSDVSDTAQTLAVVAAFADSPTTITGIGFIRRKETDRIAAMVTELRRCGIDADELPDGVRIHPGAPRGATVQTYDDHRMAMSFALLGLRTPDIRIADPGCVAKTFPGYWDALDQMRRGSGGPSAS